MPIGRGLAVALMLLAASAPVLPAATLLVRPDGTGDYPTIQAAIDATAEGDTVALSDGTFTGPGNKNLDYRGKAITVSSQNGDPEACVIECEYSGRGFRLHTGEGPGTRIEYITVAHGQADQGGAAYCSGVEASFTGCVFLENRGWEFDVGSAGAIRGLQSHLTFTRCAFVRNSAQCYMGGPWGGGIFCSSGVLVVTECEFMENAAGWGWGGGMALDHGVSAVILDSAFTENSNGAVYLESSSPFIERCEFTANVGSQFGGAIACNDGSSPVITSCTFIQNSAGIGSGVDCYMASSPTIRGCTFHAMHGDVINAEESSFPVLGNTIIVFAESGSTVRCDASSGVTLTCCDLYGNAGGDWVGCIEGQYGVSGNFSEDPLFCDPLHEDVTLAVESPCAPENSPEGCGLIGAWSVACETPMAADPLAVPALGLRLGPIQPAPATGAVRIACTVAPGRPRTALVLRIHDPSGRCVRRHEFGSTVAGLQWFDWDGRGDNGIALPSGTYFVRVGESDTETSGRVVLIR